MGTKDFTHKFFTGNTIDFLEMLLNSVHICGMEFLMPELPWSATTRPLEPETTDRTCRRIASRFAERSSGNKQPRKSRMTVNAELEKAIYELAIGAHLSSSIDTLTDLAVRNGHDIDEDEENIFKIALGAVFPTEQFIKQKRLGKSFITPPRSTYNRIPLKLSLAYTNFVPPCFLEGFLLQVRNRDVSNLEPDQTIIDGFEEWVVLNLASMPDGIESSEVSAHHRYGLPPKVAQWMAAPNKPRIAYATLPRDEDESWYDDTDDDDDEFD